MFVGPVNNAWVHCSRKKSTFKAKKKKRAENANHPDPNTTLITFLICIFFLKLTKYIKLKQPT